MILDVKHPDLQEGPSSVPPTPPSELTLNPGPGTRKKKPSGSACKCLLLTSLVLLVLLIIIGIAQFISTVVHEFSTPHRGLYQNATWEEVKKNGKEAVKEVVRPLVGREDTFDVLATVWIGGLVGLDEPLPVALHQNTNPRRPSAQKDDGLEIATETSIPYHPKWRHQWEPREQDVVFTGIVYKGLRLTDKNVFTSVNLSIPTDIFKREIISDYDLRGSFVLIPSSPSLLDYATGYSSWIPNFIQRPLFRPHHAIPTTLDSLALGGISTRTLQDDIIDAYGVQFPLLEFYNTHSRCVSSANASDSTTGYDGHDYDFDDKGNEGEEGEEDSSQPLNTHSLALAKARKAGLEYRVDGMNYMTTESQPVLEYHPYIVTRTQLRVVDFTQLYNRKAYNEEHEALKATACGQGNSAVSRPSWQFCQRTFYKNGNMEVRVTLGVPDGSEESASESIRNHTEWAYAPYLTTLIAPGGPKDLLPILVNREDCAKASRDLRKPLAALPDHKTMNVTWRIQFSGRTPGKLFFSDTMFPAGMRKGYNMTGSEYQKAKFHGQSEILQGLHGHRFDENAHPRRLAIISLIQSIIEFSITLLSIHYWYTLSTTTGISIPGTICILTSHFLQFAFSIVEKLELAIPSQGKNHKLRTIAILFTVVKKGSSYLPIPLMMLKAVTRAEVGWWKGWFPALTFLKATHRERASQRLDNRTPWRTKAAILFAIVAGYYWLQPDQYLVVTPGYPLPSDDELNPAEINLLLPQRVTIMPLLIAGSCFQLIMNYRSRTFSGMYKIQALLATVLLAVELALDMPAVVGTVTNIASRLFTAHGLMIKLLIIANFWQAATLPSVPDISEDEDSN